jgi:hypothetical protein
VGADMPAYPIQTSCSVEQQCVSRNCFPASFERNELRFSAVPPLAAAPTRSDRMHQASIPDEALNMRNADLRFYRHKALHCVGKLRLTRHFTGLQNPR